MRQLTTPLFTYSNQILRQLLICLLLLPIVALSQETSISQEIIKDKNNTDFAFVEIDKFTSDQQLQQLQHYLNTSEQELLTINKTKRNTQGLLVGLKFTIAQKIDMVNHIREIELSNSKYISPLYIIVQYNLELPVNIYYTTTYPSELEQLYFDENQRIVKDESEKKQLDMATYLYHLIEQAKQNPDQPSNKFLLD